MGFGGAAPAEAQEVRTGTDGAYSMSTVPTGQYSLGVAARGLEYQEVAVSVGAGPVTRDFALALEALTGRLARMLVQDGEGATKLVSIIVRGAASRRDALVAARSVANSPLVKTAINGQDPNWGRIMMALGKSAVA